MAKNACKLTKDEFVADQNLNTVKVTITDPVTNMTTDLLAERREFSTGSYGWFLTGKASINGMPVQVGGNFILVGSKPAKE